MVPDSPRTLRWRAVSGAALAVFALLLAYVPLASGLRLREHFACEWNSPLPMWWAGAANLRHGVAYAVAFLAAALWFKTHRLGKATSLTLTASAIVELQQAFFVEGHCRVRDLLPNVLAVGAVVGLSKAVGSWRKRQQGDSKS